MRRALALLFNYCLSAFSWPFVRVKALTETSALLLARSGRGATLNLVLSRVPERQIFDIARIIRTSFIDDKNDTRIFNLGFVNASIGNKPRKASLSHSLSFNGSIFLRGLK